MEYRLTFHALAIGSLAFCFSILATAWVLQWVGRKPVRLRRGYPGSYEPGGDDRRLAKGQSRRSLRTSPSGAFGGSGSPATEAGRVARGEARPALHYRAG